MTADKAVTLNETTRQQLLTAAKNVRQAAYAPYSDYPVGAALLTADGSVVTGCNVENATFGATICAERTAVVKAVSEGQRDFVALALVTSTGGAPCGICRQVLYEFAPDMTVIIADDSGRIVHEGSLRDLLPLCFTPEYLPDD